MAEDKKLIDEEIVKALEEWRKELIADYQRLQLLDAPMDCFEESHADIVTKLSNSLDLINRLQAENESLKKANEMFTDIGKLYSEVKAEAYKECIERVKENFTEQFCGQKYDLIHSWFDNVLKMIGE